VKVLALKAGREKSVKRRHPWIFSGAVERVTGNPQSGDTVEVRSADGKPLALAAFSPQSQIRARAWSFDAAATIDAGFLHARLQAALRLRESLPATRHTNAMRLVHGESDGLPGLVVDRYGDPPEEVDALSELMQLRVRLRALRVRGLEAGPGRVVLSPRRRLMLSSGKSRLNVVSSRTQSREPRVGSSFRLRPTCELVSTPRLPDIPSSVSAPKSFVLSSWLKSLCV